MNITHCVNELNRLIEEDGDLDVESIVINRESLSIKIEGEWYDFNEYKTTT